MSGLGHWLKSRPIGQKLTVMFATTSAMALLAACLVLWGYEWRAYRQNLQRDMTTLTDTVADSAAAALAFHDNRAAGEALAILLGEPRVLAACLFRADGSLAASVGDPLRNPCPPKPPAPMATFRTNSLVMARVSKLNGEDQGVLWLSTDLKEMQQQLKSLAELCVGAMAAALLLTIIVSSTLQRLISAPILALAAIAGKVSAHRDYSLRAARDHDNDDELGTLVDSFNGMMEQINERDKALGEARDDLERRVRERTSELEDEIDRRKRTEGDLMAAKEQAEDSNRAKSAFLANMSHELRTPLNAIIGYSELMEEDQIDAGNESAVADLGHVKSAALHLLDLIQDILDLSRIEAGRVDLHMQPMRARDLIEDLSVIEPLAKRNRNRLVVAAGDSDYRVTVDLVRFRQVLFNLLSNACKFTEDGTVTLSITEKADENGSWVCWTVRDTGPGIAAADLGKLFQSFSQVDSSATRKHGGTGLGLAISQRFCQLMGGRVVVESELGVGSAFSILLPECPAPGVPAVSPDTRLLAPV